MHLIENLGVILMPVRVPNVAREFSPSQLPVQTLLVLQYLYSLCECDAVCSQMHHICMHVKNPKSLFGHKRILPKVTGTGLDFDMYIV